MVRKASGEGHPQTSTPSIAYSSLYAFAQWVVSTTKVLSWFGSVNTVLYSPKRSIRDRAYLGRGPV